MRLEFRLKSASSLNRIGRSPGKASSSLTGKLPRPERRRLKSGRGRGQPERLKPGEESEAWSGPLPRRCRRCRQWPNEASDSEARPD